MYTKKITKLTYYIIMLTVMICSSSCSKSEAGVENNSEQYLSCKLNGKEYSFNYRVNANDKPAEKEVHFVVIGGWEKDDMVSGFGIDMVVPGEGAKEQTYSVAGGDSPELAGKYYFQNYKDGKITGTTVYSGGRSEDTAFTLTITSLTAWGVKGTFSGKLRLNGGDEYITVTDGKFSAPYN